MLRILSYMSRLKFQNDKIVLLNNIFLCIPKSFSILEGPQGQWKWEENGAHICLKRDCHWNLIDSVLIMGAMVLVLLFKPLQLW